MAAAPTAGRDKKGRPLCRKAPATGREIPDDAVAEIARVARNPTRQEGENEPAATARGFRLQPEEIVNRIYLPGYYNPKLHQDLETLRNSGKYDLISIGDLVGRKVVVITRGAVIGAEHYSAGDIPCIRTTALGNWEVSQEPQKRVSQEVYEQYRRRQCRQVGDILLVNAGAFRSGRTVMLTRQDLQSVVQSHCRILRVTDPDNWIPTICSPC